MVNFPKLHHDNGAEKGRRTGDRYKRTVRMFKSARNHLETTGQISSKLAPSYFLECLLYNTPDSAYQWGFQDTYCSIVNWINQTNLESLIWQNEQHYLFGGSDEQWTVADAKTLGPIWLNCGTTGVSPVRLHSYELEGRGKITVALAVVSILLVWLLNYVWRWRLWRNRRLLKVPDLNGE